MRELLEKIIIDTTISVNDYNKASAAITEKFLTPGKKIVIDCCGRKYKL